MRIAPIIPVNNRQQHFSYINITSTNDVFEKQELSFEGLLPRKCHYSGHFKEGVDNENVALLKKLITEKNWEDFNPFGTCDMCLIKNAKKSENQEVQKLFSGKYIYNLLKKYDISDLFKLLYNDLEIKFPIFADYHNNEPNPIKRRNIGDALASRCLGGYYKYPAELAQIPMTNYERMSLKDRDCSRATRETIEKANKLRVENIAKKNGFKTPEQLLACVNDVLMSTELLTEAFNEGFRVTDGQYVRDIFIEKIAKIPAGGENSGIISQIIEKLKEHATVNKLPDNNTTRKSALIAAKNGNVELLQYFDSIGIHYANSLKEPLDSYPVIVQETLKNAKKNDPQVLELANYPQFINKYFDEHPNVDINSYDKDGCTLAIKAAQEKSLETLKVLAARDDVDWNAIDNNGKNILMQILNESKDDVDFEYKLQVVELLRNLPEGKFDINYINETPEKRKFFGPYTALSVLFDGPIQMERRLLNDILAFPKVDTNLNPRNDFPLILSRTKDYELFKTLYEHPNTDTGLINKENIANAKAVHDRWNSTFFAPEVMEFLRKKDDKKNIEWAKNLYDTNGELTLDDIEMFLKYERLNQVINTKFNILGENIGHLLADIFPDTSNLQELARIRQIVLKLIDSGFDFNAKDDLDRTPLDKAIEGDNEVIAYLLRRYL